MLKNINFLKRCTEDDWGMVSKEVVAISPFLSRDPSNMVIGGYGDSNYQKCIST